MPGNSPKSNINMSVTAGVFTLTGNAATFYRGKALNPVVGTFTLTGNAANLVKITALSLAAAPGVFTVTGNAAVLNFGYKLTAAVGTFALNGAAAAFTKGTGLGFNAVTLTAGLYNHYTMSAAVGRYTVTFLPLTTIAAINSIKRTRSSFYTDDTD
jgi:hypothetical protein